VITTHVLLWSQRQNALHIEETELMLSSNRAAYRENRSMDYVPLWFGTLAQCQTTALNLHGTMSKRAHETQDESNPGKPVNEATPA
jgi:hypothetical protein